MLYLLRMFAWIAGAIVFSAGVAALTNAYQSAPTPPPARATAAPSGVSTVKVRFLPPQITPCEEIVEEPPAYTDDMLRNPTCDCAAPPRDMYDQFEVERKPVFGENDVDLQRYIAQNWRWRKGLDTCVSGRVILIFVVRADGVTDGICVLRSLAPHLDTSAMRLVANMPPWRPAMHCGRPVATRVILPFHISMDCPYRPQRSSSSEARPRDASEDMPQWAPAEANGHPARMPYADPSLLNACVDTGVAPLPLPLALRADTTLAGDRSIEIWPNPSAGPVTVRYSGHAGPLNLTVYDLKGQVVYRRQTTLTTGVYCESFDLSDRPTGAYVVRAVQAGSAAARTVVKQ